MIDMSIVLFMAAITVSSVFVMMSLSGVMSRGEWSRRKTIANSKGVLKWVEHQNLQMSRRWRLHWSYCQARLVNLRYVASGTFPVPMPISSKTSVLLKNSNLFYFNDLCKLPESLPRFDFIAIFGRNQY